jgi:hypothetical protein
MITALLLILAFAGWLGLAYVGYRIGMRFAPSFFGGHDPETAIALAVLLGALSYAFLS